MEKKYLLLFLMLILVVSCKKDDHDTVKLAEGEQEIEMSFASPIGYASPADGTVDQRIVELDLLVFKDGKYLYSRPGYYSSLYDKYRAVLKIDNNLTLFFLVNSRELLEKYESEGILVENTPWNQELFSKLLLEQPGKTLDSRLALPMWGRLTNVSINDSQVNDLSTVSLLRSVASANLVFKTNKDDFELTHVYLYNPASEAYLVPRLTSIDENEPYNVIEPNCPTAMETLDTPYDFSTLIDNQSVLQAIYMFENDADYNVNSRKRTRLVVGGKYKKSSKVTYYPLDFVSTDKVTNEKEIIDVVRNYRYVIEVASVNSEGWENPDEAAESASVNMDYEVIDWTDSNDKNIIIDGPDYLSVGDHQVTLYREAGSNKSVSFSTNVSIEKIKMDFINTSGTDVIENGIAIGTENSHYKAEIIFENNSIKAIKITALQEYNSIYNSETLKILAGRIEFVIKITRKSFGENDWNDGGDEETEIGKPR